MPDRKLILDGAAQAVLRERNKTYGEPDEDFQRIARIASAMGFRLDLGDGTIRHLKGSDVSLFMIALKASRLVWAPDHQDSWTDMAGYAACGFETARLQEARLAPRPSIDADHREGPRRLGVTVVEWDALRDLADRVQNGAAPSVLEDQKFLITTAGTGPCKDCELSKGKERHSYDKECAYRIRPRRAV
jgi:hypothetical protein